MPSVLPLIPHFPVFPASCFWQHELLDTGLGYGCSYQQDEKTLKSPKGTCPVAVPCTLARAHAAFAQAAGVKCEAFVTSAGGGREGVGWTQEMGF